ncbi:hypothetical protein, partial [Clostridium paraputrificum]
MKDVKKIIEKKISEISNEESTILVLKGIDIKLLYNDLNINIEKIIDNKLLYFMNIVQNNRKVITYDEYLALYNLVSMQYKRIIILENNMFINYYPLYSTISEKKLCNLLNHYDDEKEGDKYEIGGIDELTSIYGNIKLINSRYYIIYNNIVSSEKEEKIDIFEKIIINIEKEEFKVCKNCYEINDEEDYLAMLDDLLNNHVKTIQILEKNVMFNKIILEDKIKVLKYVFGDSVEIKVGFIKEKVTEEVVRQEY